MNPIQIATEEYIHHPEVIEAIGERGFSVQMASGDYVHVAAGAGPTGGDGMAAIEYKTPRDVMKSIIDHRLIDQLHRMKQTYSVSVLLIDRIVVPDHADMMAYLYNDGLIIPASPPDRPDINITYNRYAKTLLTIQQVLRVTVVERANPILAARFIVDHCDWWQVPPSHHTSYVNEYDPVGLIGGRMSRIRALVSRLDAIGVTRSYNVEQRAKELGASIREVINWDVSTWETVPGIGPKIAKDAHDELGGLV